jgi:hypothetical protein
MWGMVTFLAALSCLFFRETTTPTRVTLILVEGFVLVLILWYILFAWSEEEGQGISRVYHFDWTLTFIDINRLVV